MAKKKEPEWLGDHYEAHYLQIRELGRELGEATGEYEAAKEQAATRKKRRDRINDELVRVIARGPDPQRPLPFDAEDGWQHRDVMSLGLSDAVADKLEDAGLETLGKLQDYWNADKYLTDVGLSEDESATVADQFAAYGARHPEVYAGREG